MDIADNLKTEVFDAIADEFHQRNRRGGTTSANRHARAEIDSSWDTLEDRLRLVSGKSMFRELSKWSKEIVGVSFGPLAVAREMRSSEVPLEMKSVVRAIEQRKRFPEALKRRT